MASKSPRRHEILNLAGINHDIVVSEADETLPEGISASDAVAELSRRKAAAVFEKIIDEAHSTSGTEEFIIIAADTMVEVGGEILGKPQGRDDAKRMLTLLSDSSHFVHTGVTVTDGERTVCESVSTRVRMRKIEDDEMTGYLDSSEPFDKAGAYGIQGIGGAFVSRLEGDYFNVMGLPLCRVCEILRGFGITLFDNKKSLRD